MVIIWYAGVFLLKGVVRAVAGGVGAGGDMPNWMTFLISDVPLYLIAMPVAVRSWANRPSSKPANST